MRALLHELSTLLEGSVTWGNSTVTSKITSKVGRDYTVEVRFQVEDFTWIFLFSVYRHRLKKYLKPELIRAQLDHKGKKHQGLPSDPRRMKDKVPKGMYKFAIKQATLLMKQEHTRST